MLSGWVDSLCLAFAWTLILLNVVERYGLQAAGLFGAAMLVGTALSAPVATHLAAQLTGRQLLRTAGGVEAVLRAGVFALLLVAAPVWMLLLCIVAMNITAWTGYAGMRAEVAAVAPGPKALTLYGTGVAALEAVGAACAVLVPSHILVGASVGGAAIVVMYVLALVPTLVIAGGSSIAPIPAPRLLATRARPSGAMVAGVVLMFIASGPTLLSVALTAELFGRSAVAPAAIAFTIGSMSAPALAGLVQRHGVNDRLTWTCCAVAMVALWPLAPLSLSMLCLAQVASGFAMTALEGLLDAHVAARTDSSVTGALARTTAGRALGSAAGTAALPIAVTSVGLTNVTTLLAVLLGAGAASFGFARWGREAPAASLEGPADSLPSSQVAALAG